MAWCERCHYGSETCRLPKIAETIDVPDGAGEAVSVTLSKCPQCGAIGLPLMKASWLANRTRTLHGNHKSGKHKGTRKQNEDGGDSLHEEVQAVTGGDVKAFNYEKLSQ